MVNELQSGYCREAVLRVPPQRFPIANASLLLVEKFWLSVRLRERRRISLKGKRGAFHRQGTSSISPLRRTVESNGHQEK